MGERSQDILARRSEGGGIMKIPISKLLNWKFINDGDEEGWENGTKAIN